MGNNKHRDDYFTLCEKLADMASDLASGKRFTYEILSKRYEIGKDSIPSCIDIINRFFGVWTETKRGRYNGGVSLVEDMRRVRPYSESELERELHLNSFLTGDEKKQHLMTILRYCSPNDREKVRKMFNDFS